ncbi:trace amine-associated receptor 5 [Nematostella vectensis]|uniref:trace amine-associated receptor 5 n=1 Tax=Nematostella vectensis TaxID=45351 RepID=UPI0020771E21|nr:trace amine-associated receptor 5 [Nematostella vectensis]XP_032231263.2 trace amine-associated receptor 5 [Nematostella vectensis]
MYNSTNTSREYVFTPAGLPVKMSLTVIQVLFGGFAVVANGTYIYLRRKMKRKSHHVFSRSMTSYFTQSLAWSNVLCCVISLPLVLVQYFVDVFQNDFGCRAVRFFQFVFPVVTMFNLVVIGVERYMATFHPFLVPTERITRRRVIAAWGVGVVVTLIPIPTFGGVPFDIDEGTYTIICKYNNDVAVYRVMFLTFNLVVYFIPSIALTIISYRIRRYMTSNRFVAHNRQCTIRTNSWRFQGTRMFSTLILAFILPYMLYMVYSAVNMILRPVLSFTTDYIIRYTSGVLAYGNAALSPIIVFTNMRDVRQTLMDSLRKLTRNRRNAVHTSPETWTEERSLSRHREPNYMVHDRVPNVHFVRPNTVSLNVTEVYDLA